MFGISGLRVLYPSCVILIGGLAACGGGGSEEAPPTVQNTTSVAGMLVRPSSIGAVSSQGLKGKQVVALASGCTDVPAGYEPLSNVTINLLDASGLAINASVRTDDCGRFSATVPASVAKLQVTSPGSEDRSLDVADFRTPSSLGSLVPSGATYQIAGFSYLGQGKVGVSIVDSVTSRSVLGLSQQDFQATINNLPAQVLTVDGSVLSKANGRTASASLVLDASGSMGSFVDPFGDGPQKIAVASIAAGTFLSGKDAADRVAITVFDHRVFSFNDAAFAGPSPLLKFFANSTGARVPLSTSASGFTSDLKPLLGLANAYNGSSAIYKTTCIAPRVCDPLLPGSDPDLYAVPRTTPLFGGMTALWDAVSKSIDQVEIEQGSRFVIVMTDGQDNASAVGSAAVISKAKALGIPVWMIAFGDDFDVNEEEMKSVALATGGSYFRKQDADLIGVFSAIQSGVRFQYGLTLDTKPVPGATVKIKVGNTTRELTVPATP